MLAAVTLLAGPALFAAGLAITSFDFETDSGVPDQAVIAEYGDRQLLATNLSSLGILLMIGSVLAMAAVAARGRPRLAVSGAALSLLGLGSMLIYSVYDVALVATDGLDSAAATEFGTAFVDATESVLTYWLYPPFVVGGIVLAVALWQSRQVPKWAAVCVGVGVLFPLAPVLGVGAIAVVFGAVRIVGSVPVAGALSRRAVA